MSCGMPRGADRRSPAPSVGHLRRLLLELVDERQHVGPAEVRLSLSVPSTLRSTRSILVTRAVELAGEDREAAVDREVGVVDAGAVRRRRSSTAASSSAGRGSRAACSASATTIADLPSGVKYMLYGSSTAIAVPGLAGLGSIGVRLPSVRPSALLATQSVRRSHDGTTCCGLRPTLKVSTTLSVAGSITETVVGAQVGHVDARQVARDAPGSAGRRRSRCRGWSDR